MAKIGKGLLDTIVGKIGDVTCYKNKIGNIAQVRKIQGNRLNTQNCVDVTGQLQMLDDAYKADVANMVLYEQYMGYDYLKNRYECFIGFISKLKAKTTGIYKAQAISSGLINLKASVLISYQFELEKLFVNYSVSNVSNSDLPNTILYVFIFNRLGGQGSGQYIRLTSRSGYFEINAVGTIFEPRFYVSAQLFVKNKTLGSKCYAVEIVK